MRAEGPGFDTQSTVTLTLSQREIYFYRPAGTLATLGGVPKVAVYCTVPIRRRCLGIAPGAPVIA